MLPASPLAFTLDDLLAASKAPSPTSRCYWVVAGRLLAGAYPGDADPAAHAARIGRLWGAGMRTFVSLMEERETNWAGVPFVAYQEHVQRLADEAGERASCVRFAVRDKWIPEIGTMRSILDEIDRELAAHRGVYVHCWGGIGRTGTVIGCWLRRHGLATAVDVVAVLARLRQADVERAQHPSPENDEQRRFVTSWRE